MTQLTNPYTEPTKAANRDSLASLKISRPEAVAPRKSRKGWIVLLLLLAGVCFAGYRMTNVLSYELPSWLGSASTKVSDWVPDVMQDRPEVQLTALTTQTGRAAEAVVVATGYIGSRQQARIGARATGRIQSIHFDEGSKVKQNDTLAVLEHTDIDAVLKSSNASVAIAKAALVEQKIAIEKALLDLKRAESLSQQRSIADSELEVARFAHQTTVARYNSLAAQLELSTARMNETEEMRANMFIRAPFSGTVISKDAEVGESILPGGMGEASGRGSVATIADLEHLEIECDVKEDFIARIYSEQNAEITVDAVPGKKYHGTVRKVIPMGDRARATIKVKVEIDDSDELLFPEMSGSAFFLPKEAGSDTNNDHPRIFCPTSAVVPGGPDGNIVWVVDANARAQKLSVKVGESRDGKTEIVAGLTGRERVVTLPQAWQAGQAVKVIE